MRPALRAAITAGSVVLAAGLAIGFRSLTAFGVFTDVVPGFAGTCTAVPTANGPEDIAIDDASGLIFISALDRRAKAAGHPAKTDGLYVFALNEAVPHPRKVAGTPSDFHPHGISLYRAPGGDLTLMAINHRSDGAHSVDIFDVKIAPDGAVLASETGSIQSGQLVSPNAVAAVDATRFYVANDHGSTTQLGRTLDDDLVLPRANTLFFDGTVFRVVAQRMAFPSGAVVSADGRYLYVGESYNRRITAFARNPITGELTEAGEIALPTNVDNLRLDAGGTLWAGSHPKAFAMAAWRAYPSKPAPSQIFKVTLKDGIPQSATPVYTDLGSEIGGSSVGAVSGHRLLIGSPFDNHILDCRMDH